MLESEDFGVQQQRSVSQRQIIERMRRRMRTKRHSCFEISSPTGQASQFKLTSSGLFVAMKAASVLAFVLHIPRRYKSITNREPQNCPS